MDCYQKILTYMKIKLYLTFYILSIFLLTGCEQEFDNTIENFIPEYQAVSVTPTAPIKFNASDSLITITIKINSPSSIKNVFCDIYSSEYKKLNSSPIELFDNGLPANGDAQISDNRFSNKFPLSTNYPGGTYSIKYYAIDKSKLTKQIAVGTFDYDNGQNNIAPVISNEFIDPDTAVVTTSQVILTSVKVFDANGLSDIEKVYFIVYRPNGTTNGIQNLMFDDGDVSSHGDQIAGDGIYSLIIQITSSNTKGTYRFEFAARDRGGKLSNIINHNVLIQ